MSAVLVPSKLLKVQLWATGLEKGEKNFNSKLIRVHKLFLFRSNLYNNLGSEFHTFQNLICSIFYRCVCIYHLQQLFYLFIY